MQRQSRLTFLLFAILAASGTASAISPEDKCEADKNKIAGKYAFCRQNAEAKAIKKGDPPDFSKCDSKLLIRWANAELKAVRRGTSCIDSTSDLAIQSLVTAHTDQVAAALDGGTLPECGDDLINVVGEQCDGTDLGGEDCTTLGFSGGSLACDGACGFDTTSCTVGGGGLVPGIDPILPATGQTTAYGPGSDGSVQAGAALSYTDNGDGTITDNTTGLVWEKKDDSGGINDWDDQYTWSAGTNDMYGTITSTFLAVLNGDHSGCNGAGNPDPCCTGVGTGTCTPFAGYTDWRIPNYKELTSILNLEEFAPSVDPAFHQSATCTGCVDATLETCSCTATAAYWSSTSGANFPDSAWLVVFGDGYVGPTFKNSLVRVRAVRGGL